MQIIDALKKRYQNKKHVVRLVLCLTGAVGLVLLRPFGLDTSTSIVLAAFLFTLLAWMTKWFDRTAVSLMLLLVFLFFSNNTPRAVFGFLFSDSFLVLVAVMMIAQCVVEYRLADKALKTLLNRFSASVPMLILFSFVIELVLSFVLYDPMSRMLLVCAVYVVIMEEANVNKGARGALLFSIFAASNIVSLMFVNGTAMLTSSVMEMTQLSLTWLQWVKYMTLPTAVSAMLIGVVYYTVFRKELKTLDVKTLHFPIDKTPMNKEQKKILIVLLSLTIAWITQGIHGVSAGKLAVLAVLILMAMRLVKPSQIKKLNYRMLIFLTAIFAIGSSMKAAGLAQMLNDALLHVMPMEVGGIWPLLIAVVVAMALHMLLGSALGTSAIVIPGFLLLFAERYDPHVVMLSLYIAVSIHYLMSFHRVSISVGVAQNYFDEKTIFRFGLPMTAVTLVVLLIFYFPYWKLMGLF